VEHAFNLFRDEKLYRERERTRAGCFHLLVPRKCPRVSSRSETTATGILVYYVTEFRDHPRRASNNTRLSIFDQISVG